MIVVIAEKIKCSRILIGLNKSLVKWVYVREFQVSYSHVVESVDVYMICTLETQNHDD